MKRFAAVASVVVVQAVIQALLVLGDPTPTWSPTFVLLAIASAAELVLAVWLVARLVSPGPGAPLRRVLVLGVVAVAVGLLSPFAVPVVLVLGAPWLVGASPRAAPLHSAVLIVVGLAAAVISWIVLIAVGFFVGGPVAAFLTWLWLGAVGAVVLWRWAARAARLG